MKLSSILKFLLLLVFPFTAIAQESNNHDATEYPAYILFTDRSNPASVLDINNAELIPIIYRVNNYTLVETPLLDSIVATLQRVQNDPRTSLRHVWIGGSASPEGPLWWNKRLGDYRSAALVDYLITRGVVPDSLVTVINLEEDWHNTIAYLQRHDFPNGNIVLEIIDKQPDRTRRKAEIRNIDGGVTWNRLIREVFPPLRNARLIIECSPMDTIPELRRLDSHELVPELALNAPELLPPPITSIC
ncbi:MAG: hypothetical protein ACI31C_01455 [Muribaculaceae bacterium]